MEMLPKIQALQVELGSDRVGEKVQWERPAQWPPGAAMGHLPQRRQESMATTKRGSLPCPPQEASTRRGQGTVWRAEPGRPPETTGIARSGEALPQITVPYTSAIVTWWKSELYSSYPLNIGYKYYL